MSASALDISNSADSHQDKRLSWWVAGLLGAIVFCGSLGLSLLVRQIILGHDAGRSAIVNSADPDYRIGLLEKAVSRNPTDASAWLQLGHAYSESDRNAQAATAYENSLAINPRSPNIWTKLGTLYSQTDRPHKALEAFDKAITLNPKDEASHLYKGMVLLNAFNDLRGAVHSWIIILELNPNAVTPCGTAIEEWVRYCLTASEPKFARADERDE
jgi:cytochrome c-type biogenesis protein CcmH/NrfG